MGKKLIVVISSLVLISSCLFAKDNITGKLSYQSPNYNVGKWLSSDQKFYDEWFKEIVKGTKSANQPLHPVIQEFKDLIEGDPELLMLFTEMFEQIPKEKKFEKDTTGKHQIKNYHQMLHIMNRILTMAPEFNKTGFVGFPINAILNWPMGTPAGSTAFLNEKVNHQLKKILNQWSVFLASPDSRYVLNDNPKSGWFGKDAKEAMPNFTKEIKCDPKAPYYGFSSWDNFFTREFREGIRPVSNPEDDTVIVNACESAPYKIARNVQLSDRFWIKSQPYSLKHMMASDSLAKEFAGGTVYQAFLSALSYHRWHSPISGTIVKTKLIDGSYYAEALSEGFDPVGPNSSQGYITQVASRGLIFIEADNKDIGLMAVLFVGMAEVSSNEFSVYEGQHVKKGDQLGMFHFGGSTHCLIFKPGVELEFDLHGQTPGLDAKNILLKEQIATVKNNQRKEKIK